MIELRMARPGDEAGQKLIWELSFEDPEQVVEAHFGGLYRPENTALLLSGGKIVCRTETIPVEVVGSDGRAFAAYYIYALATHPEYRGKGYASRLLDFAREHWRARGVDAAVVAPADENLFAMYRKMGFVDAFYLRETAVTVNPGVSGKPDGELIPAAPEQYLRVREDFLAGLPHVRYDERLIACQKRISQAMGCDSYILNVGGALGCASVELYHGGKAVVKDFLLPAERLREGLALIAQTAPRGRLIVRAPALLEDTLGGRIRCFGMLRGPAPWPADQSGYLGIAFD